MHTLCIKCLESVRKRCFVTTSITKQYAKDTTIIQCNIWDVFSENGILWHFSDSDNIYPKSCLFGAKIVLFTKKKKRCVTHSHTLIICLKGISWLSLYRLISIRTVIWPKMLISLVLSCVKLLNKLECQQIFPTVNSSTVFCLCENSLYMMFKTVLLKKHTPIQVYFFGLF